MAAVSALTVAKEPSLGLTLGIGCDGNLLLLQQASRTSSMVAQAVPRTAQGGYAADSRVFRQGSEEPNGTREISCLGARSRQYSLCAGGRLAVRGLAGTIDEALKKHGLSEHDDKRIAGLCNAFGIAADELGPAGMRFAKAEVLQNLDEKRLPSKTHVENMPINLEQDESIIWLFNQVTYHTTRHRTHRGIFVIASHNVYFWSWRKAMKIPAKKINSVVPYSDRLQIMQDGANPAPHIFKRSCPSEWCNSGEAVVISGKAGLIKLSRRRAA